MCSGVDFPSVRERKRRAPGVLAIRVPPPTGSKVKRSWPEIDPSLTMQAVLDTTVLCGSRIVSLKSLLIYGKPCRARL